jgi:hypothetical protein
LGVTSFYPFSITTRPRAVESRHRTRLIAREYAVSLIVRPMLLLRAG